MSTINQILPPGLLRDGVCPYLNGADLVSLSGVNRYFYQNLSNEPHLRDLFFKKHPILEEYSDILFGELRKFHPTNFWKLASRALEEIPNPAKILKSLIKKQVLETDLQEKYKSICGQYFEDPSSLIDLVWKCYVKDKHSLDSINKQLEDVGILIDEAFILLDIQKGFILSIMQNCPDNLQDLDEDKLNWILEEFVKYDGTYEPEQFSDTEKVDAQHHFVNVMKSLITIDPDVLSEAEICKFFGVSQLWYKIIMKLTGLEEDFQKYRNKVSEICDKSKQEYDKIEKQRLKIVMLQKILNQLSDFDINTKYSHFFCGIFKTAQEIEFVDKMEKSIDKLTCKKIVALLNQDNLSSSGRSQIQQYINLLPPDIKEEMWHTLRKDNATFQMENNECEQLSEDPWWKNHFHECIGSLRTIFSENEKIQRIRIKEGEKEQEELSKRLEMLKIITYKYEKLSFFDMIDQPANNQINSN